MTFDSAPCWNCKRDFDIIEAIIRAEAMMATGGDGDCRCPHCGAIHASSDIPAGAEEEADRRKK